MRIVKNERERILRIALIMFLEKNFKKVSLKQVSERTGVPRAELARYFDSIEHLFLAVAMHFFPGYISGRPAVISDKAMRSFYHVLFKLTLQLELPMQAWNEKLSA